MNGPSLGLSPISTATLRKTLAHLHRGELDFPLNIVSFTRLGMQEEAETFLRLARGLDADALRAVLVAVLAERIAQEERARG
jgi:hypothetical protein